MIKGSNTVLEHDNLFVSGKSNNESFLELFRLNKNELISDDELSKDLGTNYISPCSQLSYEADIQMT